MALVAGGVDELTVEEDRPVPGAGVVQGAFFNAPGQHLRLL
jgi:hypothetical protein